MDQSNLFTDRLHHHLRLNLNPSQSQRHNHTCDGVPSLVLSVWRTNRFTSGPQT